MLSYSLNIGDKSDNGSTEIIDKDRLCYIIKNTQKGACGLRTISRKLLDEYVQYIHEHPDAKPSDARDALSGNSDIDKFEYGYTSTLTILANMAIQKSQDAPAPKPVFFPSSPTPSPLQPFLTALRTKPFMLLAGISGTGKSRIVRKLAQATITKELQGYQGKDFANDRWQLHSPANFELIQVKPNWHNSMDVIGYLSNIPSPHYVFTPFIEFITKAWQDPDVPFFLCLDEMNLAPVEEYFAEFLSAIESRSFEADDYVTDPLIKPFNSFGEDVANQMLNSLFPNFKASDTD